MRKEPDGAFASRTPQQQQQAPDAFMSDREIVLEAVKQNWISLQFASAALQDDPRVLAVARTSKALNFASQKLRERGLKEYVAHLLCESFNVPKWIFIATILFGAKASNDGADNSSCVLSLLRPGKQLTRSSALKVKQLIWDFAGVMSGREWSLINVVGRNMGLLLPLHPIVLLVASKDQPRGIEDDLHLVRSLGGKNVIWCHWDDMPLDWKDTRCLPVIRSLWEGRDSEGATPCLQQFLISLAAEKPQFSADYKLLLWISNKRYLLDLFRESAVPIVPTVMTTTLGIPGDDHDSYDASELTISAGAIKCAMEQYGWSDAVLKPAVGTRGEGVLRLSILGDDGWNLRTALDVARLLEASSGECLLQPFLPPCPRSIGQKAAGTLEKYWGEVCVLFLNGEIVHAVHKEPRVWGWHRSYCPCSKRRDALAGAICTCDALGRPDHSEKGAGACIANRRKTSDGTISSTDEGHITGANIRVDDSIAPVEMLSLPLPAAIAVPALLAAQALPRFKELLLFRVDLLPRLVKSNELHGASWKEVIEAPSMNNVEWLVSEIEGQWCECFLRAAPDAVSNAIATAIKSRRGDSFEHSNTNFSCISNHE